MTRGQRRRSFIVDPELPPDRLLIVPDLNVAMDVALALRQASDEQQGVGQGRQPRLLTAPGPSGISVPFGRGGDILHSMMFFESLATGRFGAYKENLGVPVSVFSSYSALALLSTKLQQSANAPNREFRGFGWSKGEADRFIDDFFLPFVYETGGELFDDPPHYRSAPFRRRRRQDYRNRRYGTQNLSGAKRGPPGCDPGPWNDQSRWETVL